jgi:hypothetical protein
MVKIEVSPAVYVTGTAKAMKKNEKRKCQNKILLSAKGDN